MMKAESDTRRYSLEDLEAAHAAGDTATRPDAPAYPVEDDFWAKARPIMPQPGKTSVHLRVDTDVLDWFRAQGKGHLTRMNAVLRSYMEAHKR
jgi:uncharacterized protein (DUF4415 family)